LKKAKKNKDTTLKVEVKELKYGPIINPINSNIYFNKKATFHNQRFSKNLRSKTKNNIKGKEENIYNQ
jgi:hypothetical protein